MWISSWLSVICLPIQMGITIMKHGNGRRLQVQLQPAIYKYNNNDNNNNDK